MKIIEHVTLTYDPRFADPNEDDGSCIWAGEITERYADGGFEFAPANGEQPWSVMPSEIEQGVVAIDPKQIQLAIAL